MSVFKTWIALVLLIVVPVQMVFPDAAVLPSSNSIQDGDLTASVPFTYDDIVTLLDQLESGALESQDQVDPNRLNALLAFLAQTGITTDDPYEHLALQNDVNELLAGLGGDFQYAACADCVFLPAMYIGAQSHQIFLTGGLKHSWDKTKRFVKKHKKAILIGAAVVVATAVVMIATARSSAKRSSREAAGPKRDSTAREEGIAEVITSEDEAPLLKSAMDERVCALKEFVEEDRLESASPAKWEELSYVEKARELGAHLAHTAFEDISEMASVVPELLSEIKAIGSRLWPQGVSNAPVTSEPNEKYESFVAKGHRVIDSVFGSDQAYLFEEGRDRFEDFTVAYLPPPGAIPKTIANTRKFINAGKVHDRGGYTKAGRSLMKHGYRKNSIYPKPTGTPAEINLQGQALLETIVNHPEKVVYEYPHGRFGQVVDVTVSGIGGVRFYASGEEMVCFLEP